jgi:hypothetical protein
LKKRVSYILLTVLLLALLLLVMNAWRQRVFDKRVTFDEKSKIPYGAYLTHSLLPLMFPGSDITSNYQSPVDWYNDDSAKKGSQLFFLLTRHFNPSKTEMLDLVNFAKLGNYVFISTAEMNSVSKKYLGVSIYSDSYNHIYYSNYDDSVNTRLVKPTFTESQYFNPGYTFSTYFKSYDTSRYEIIGVDGQGAANFLKVNVGKGSIYLHSDPFLFANYFLLNADNKDYFEKSISLVPSSVRNIIWDEYYVYKPEISEKSNTPSPLRVLLNYPSFRWAFYTALIFLVLYLLLNIKRRQRLIPVLLKPTNDSLDFVKTIGRLYFEKQDHLNIAVKMTVYFLEHVRNKYLVTTSDLDDEFIEKLSGKSGYDEAKTRALIQSVIAIHQAVEVDQQQLANYYNQFQQFYKQTT